MPSKLLVLGLDAADPVLLRRWVADDKLPAIGRLMDRGTSGAVRGVDGFYIGSTWPSFYTGLNPAGHGFYRIEQLEPGTYSFFRPLDSPTGVGGIPFWRVASDAGRRVAVLDVPLTRLDPSLNGVQIVEWGGHDSVFGFQASPAALESEVLATVGEYPLPSDCDARRKTAADFEEFVSSLELAVRKKTALTLELLDQDEWDIFVQVFTEAHCAGHQCWHLHDPTHPAHDERMLATLADPLERVYRAIDRAVAAIVERAGDTHVLLLSAHGMSAYRGAGFLLSEILYRLGVTVRPKASLLQQYDSGGRFRTARTAWNMLPGVARNSLRPVRRRLETRASARPTNVSQWADVRASRCFPVPNGSPVGGIRLNVVGREPQGVLRPGPETDSFCEELVRDLLAISDGRTGSPLIAAVHRTDSLYVGARRDALPDLLVEWSDEVPTGTLVHAGGRGATVRAQSNAIGVVEGSNDYGRTGEHVPTGLFAWVGPRIPVAQRRDPVRLIDFHPTICRLLGLPTPTVDGDVIPELVAPQH
jgi:predicted AlkP superfamily phosphohydrolase/phosphomutase